MESSRKIKKVHICNTCKGNGYVKIKTILNQNHRYINVGIVNLKESFMNMLQKIIILLMMVFLTNCTSRFDGYDPTTAIVRWIITHDTRN